MKVGNIIMNGLINDDTILDITYGGDVLAQGNWYQDHILDYLSYEAEYFLWVNNGRCLIGICKEEENAE